MIFKHALKNALIPIITVIGVQFAFLMGGTVVIEQIFVYPGLGQLAITAIFNEGLPRSSGSCTVYLYNIHSNQSFCRYYLYRT